MDERIERTLKNLERNRMAAQYVPTLAQVAPAVEKMLSEDASVAVGGSMTLAETGVLELLRSVLLSLVKNYWFAVVPVALAGAMPGILSIYFTLFDVAIQAYVFMTLSVTFVNEAIE